MSAQKSLASSSVSAVSSESNLPANKARNAYCNLCEQTKNLPETSLEEINAILAVLGVVASQVRFCVFLNSIVLSDRMSDYLVSLQA